MRSRRASDGIVRPLNCGVMRLAKAMRRALWLPTLLVLCFSCAATVPHQAILGTWKSNEALTLASMHQLGGLSPEAVELFENDFFGKLVVEYRRDTARSTFPDEDYDTGFEPYEVLEVAPGYVKIREWSKTLGQWSDATIHLEAI
jgi:hypothetical protein